MKRTYTEEEKRQFAENAKAKADAAMAALENGIKDMYSGENYKKYLKFFSGFHQYSFCNTVLIVSQLPSASLCASFPDWKKKGRYVKKGEKVGYF